MSLSNQKQITLEIPHEKDSPSMSEDTATIAVLATKIDHITAAVEEIKTSLATSATVHVTRSEWELRNQVVDERFVTTKADIVEHEARIKALEDKRLPWGIFIAVGVGLVSLTAFVFEWIPRIIN